MAVPAVWVPLNNTFGAVWEGSDLGGMPPYDLQIASPNATVNAPCVPPLTLAPHTRIAST